MRPKPSTALFTLLLAACGVSAQDAATTEKKPSFAASGSRKPEPFAVEDSAVLQARSQSGRQYEVYVKTPPGYGKPENASRTYPVVYLTDGAYTFQVASGVSRLPFSQKRFDEFILVGLSGAKGEDPAASRRRDLTPWQDTDVAGFSGGASTYLDFIQAKLIPLVEGNYRVDKSNRTLVGQSYGGLFTLWVALKRPELFQNYIASSPSLWFDKHRLLHQEAEFAKTNSDLKARIYIAVGSREHPQPGGCDCEHDMVTDSARFAAALRSRHYHALDLRDEVVSGTFHETTFPIVLTLALQWLFMPS